MYHVYISSNDLLASSLASVHSSWHSGSRKHNSPSSDRFSRVHFLPGTMRVVTMMVVAMVVVTKRRRRTQASAKA